MNNDYRNDVREQLSRAEQNALSELKQKGGETDSGKSLSRLAQQLHTDVATMRAILRKLQELRLVEPAPEGALNDGGRHYRLTPQGRGFLPK